MPCYFGLVSCNPSRVRRARPRAGNGERGTRHPLVLVDVGGRRTGGKTRAPMTGKNIWRLCKVYGRLIGCPELKPHDLRHGVAMELLEQHHGLAPRGFAPLMRWGVD
jgi:integrase